MLEVTIREANIDDFHGVGRVFTDELRHHINLLPDRFQLAKPIITPE